MTACGHDDARSRRELFLAAPIKHIQNAVAQHYGVARISILARRCWGARIGRPRHVAMYLAKILTVFSERQIGRDFGGRCHASIRYAVKKVTALEKTDPQIAADLRAIKAMLGFDMR